MIRTEGAWGTRLTREVLTLVVAQLSHYPDINTLDFLFGTSTLRN